MIRVTALLAGFLLALGAHAQAPTIVSLLPAEKTVVFSTVFELTVHLSSPSPAGGTFVDIVVAPPGSLITSSVTVPEGMTSALINVAAGFSSGQSTVTAILNGAEATATITVLENPVAPGAPVIGAATPGSAQASIAFSPPIVDGGAPVTSYTATCQPGGVIGNGTSSPVTVFGLTNGITYSCSVAATNIAGTGASSASVQVTPVGAAGKRFDFDGDGKADVFWRHSVSGQNYAFLTDGLSIVNEGYVRAVPDANWNIVGIGDFDGDGKADVLWRNSSTGENYVYFMNGAAIKPNEGYLRSVASQDWQVAGVGDFDGDGKDDILWRNRASGENYVFLMSALAVANEGYVRTVAGQDWKIAGVGDFDGNGRADILWRNSSTGQNYIFFMNGASIVNEGYVRTVADTNWGIAAVADLDGNGRADVLWRNGVSGENYVFLMQGIDIAGESYLRTVVSAWEIKGAADFDGDGKADVLWRNSASGENYVFLMNGFAIVNEGYVRTVADTNWRIAPGTVASVTNLVRFVAMGGTGSGNAGQNEVAAAVQAKCAASGCDFIQLLGDNIFDNGVDSISDPQWNTKFEAPYAAISLPFYAVLGGNDYGLPVPTSAKGQYQVDYSAVSTKWRMPAKYYRHRLQHVEFFALDSTMQRHQQDATQRTDVAAWIAASTATWKIAFGHHSYRSNGPHGNAGAYDGLPFLPPISNGIGVKTFMENVVCGSGKADAHFSSHDHSLQWLQATCNGTELIISSTGSKSTELPGTQLTHFQSLQLGFVYVSIDGNTLTAEFINTAGELLYTRTITKP